MSPAGVVFLSLALLSPAAAHLRTVLHVVTYADHATPQLCASARSAARHGIHLRVLEPDAASSRYADPRANKPAAMQRFLRSFDERTEAADLVLFADAYDVLYTGRLEARSVLHVLQAAAAPRPWNESVLLAGERNCAPYMDFFGVKEDRPGGRETCARLARGAHTSFRYINTGSWLSSVRMARTFVDAWAEELEADGEAASDQECVHRLKGRLPLFVDQDCTLFQTGWGTPLEHKKTLCLPGVFCLRSRPWRAWLLPNCTVYNTETLSRPPLVHFNGDKRNFMPAAAFCERGDGERAETEARLHALAARSPVLKACLK